MTLLSFKQHLYVTLKDHYPTTELDSFFRILLEDVLKLSKIDVALNPQQEISKIEQLQLQNIIDGLMTQQPIQHLIGFTEFMDLKFIVNPNVLIPRPETEELIQWIVADSISKNNIDILDIGTGTGCIPILLKHQLKQATVQTIDVSKKAIETAKENANINKVAIEFIHQDILKTEKLSKYYDVIVSNPPYVRNLEKKEMQQNVLAHEPHLALFIADEDPLIFYRKIAQLAKQALKPNGALYYEINQYLGKETVVLLKDIGFKHVTLQKDIFGNDRMIKASF
ncbi:peptide chain release factor N(5)-glutamine methyltransferase [Wenyingzhuangia sp. 1_MG-2023]|nr:peptide chain release factor N(5)-glutamine methyltransferase [Wenyingzhuangia sp. 1_MG-2023]